MSTGDVTGATLPFDEAIRFLKDKVNLPTERWTDLWEGMHARAFVVAGAMKDELVADLHQAVFKAIDQGTTLADFRKDFDRIVAAHGWSYKGGRNWRTGVILNTNLRTAYQAGRWQQIQENKARRPYLRYTAIMDDRTRPEHAAWHGTVLPADDPWWSTHYPPNGWNCRCTVQQLAEADLERFGYRLSPGAPPVETETRTINGPSGPVNLEVPKGIDPGFAYNVGDAAWGRTLTEQAMDGWRAQGGEAWESLTPGDWQNEGRPPRIPVDPPAVPQGPMLSSVEEMEGALRQVLGGEEKIFALPSGDRATVNAHTLARHIPLDRSRFIPQLPSLLEEPFEVWQRFERHKGTGRVELRRRVIKGVRLEADRYLVMAAQAVEGRLEAWTFIPTRKPGYAQDQRVGKLLWGRELGESPR
ncbi:MAG: phage minor head protein [Alphaproteobacteria bacterium]